MNPSRRICSFFLANQLFGLDVDCVLEVVGSLPITTVPLASESVRGLINLRGQIVTAINLRHILQIDPAQDSANRMNIIVKTDDGPACFSIDDVGDVLDITPENFEPVPESMNAVEKKFIECVCKLPDQILLVLKSDFSNLANA